MFVTHLGFCSFTSLCFGVHVVFWVLQAEEMSHLSTRFTPMKPTRGPRFPSTSARVRVRLPRSCCRALGGPRRSRARPRLTAQGPQTLLPPLFFSPSASFSLSSTFSVSPCFTLCLHTTPWVVPSNNIWSFPGPPCQEFLFFCRKMSRATRRIRITAIDIFARSCDSGSLWREFTLRLAM